MRRLVADDRIRRRRREHDYRAAYSCPVETQRRGESRELHQVDFLAMERGVSLTRAQYENKGYDKK